MTEPGTGKSDIRAPLAANLAWGTVGSLAYVFCQWLALSLLARWSNPATVGEFGYALAAVSPIILLTNLGLRVGKATDLAGLYDFGHYKALRLLGNVLAMGICFVVGALLADTPDTWAVIVLVALAKLMESQADLYYGLFQKHGRQDLIAWSQFARGLLSVAAFAVALAMGGGLLGAVTMQAAAWLMVFGLLDVPNGRRLLGAAASRRDSMAAFRDWRKLASLAALMLPLGIGAGVAEGARATPRYLIEHFVGLEALGYFTALVYPLHAAALFFNSLNAAALTTLARRRLDNEHASARRLVLRLSVTGIGAGLAGMIIAWLAGDLIMHLLYGPDYRQLGGLLIVVALVGAIRFAATPLQAGLVAARRFRTHLGIDAGMLCGAAVIGLLLIPTHGLAGAVWSLVFLAGWQVLLNLLVVSPAVTAR